MMTLPFSPVWPEHSARFVICIGAPKSATTFLHDQVAQDARVKTAPRKEVHFWDAQSGQMDAKWLRRVKRQYRQSGLLLPFTYLTRGKRAVTWFRGSREMIKIRTRGTDAYQAYHRQLLPDTPEQIVSFEATPAYALLPAQSFREMAAFHPNAHFLFMVRDPVERAWSGVSYILRHDVANGQVGEKDIQTRFRSIISDRSSDPWRHSDYPATLRTMEEAGVLDRTHVVFMETMMSPVEQAVLTEAFGFDVDLVPTKMVNKNKRKRSIPDDLRAIGIDAFQPIYSEMRERFGARVPDRWHA